MFRLFFDAQAKVLLARFSGVFTSEDLSALDRATKHIVAEQGLVRGILDYTDVEAMAFPRSAWFERGKRLRISPGQARVAVAPQPELYELYQDYAQGQLHIGNGPLMVVRTLAEALRQLDLQCPAFEPLFIGHHSGR